MNVGVGAYNAGGGGDSGGYIGDRGIVHPFPEKTAVVKDNDNDNDDDGDNDG